MRACAIAVAALSLCMAACSSRHSLVAPVAADLKGACAALKDQTIAHALIGLPSGNASITAASFVPASEWTASGSRTRPAMPDYCQVLGSIAPVDPAAQRINFQVNLPSAWNRKVLQYGGGGYNGILTTGLAPLRDAAPDDLLPLTRGYVTLGTDSGHQASAFAANSIGQFGMNEEMLVNYGYASYKKTRDVAVALMRIYYAQAPAKVYYFGGSEGGREGLTMAQRFPNDYDGVVSVVPVVQLSMLFQSYIPRTVPQFSGGWMNPAKVRTLAKFVSDRCDALDGVADGVVSNYLACQPRIDLQALRCNAGADAGDDCLSDAQIAMVRSVHSPNVFPFPLANGLMSYPQWFYGNETTPDPVNTTMTRWVTGTANPTEPSNAATASQYWLYGSNFVKFFVARDADFDVRTYDPANFKARVQQVSEIIDSTNPDLSVFFARGGKLIMRENMSDLAQSPQAGINYFASVAARLGQSTVERSARLYVSPASTHTGHASSVTDGSAVPTMVDLLDPLDKWATTGVAPADALVQTVKAPVSPFTLLASRPMCRYPHYPHFKGGERSLDASYTCVPSRP
ncbi:tannase/feruloyl esterase family alpha/beta hydrolase [Variovorax paradoxus]|nr:tannase/feruloyl esterase family alpha/beta hydrolase [Variovorax paradoxus]